MKRNDLTNWIIHFVHRRNYGNNPEEQIPIPDSFTYEGKPIFKTDKFVDTEYEIEPDACSFSVLKKILYDGIIRTGWSFRNNRATIYGPKSAVCFTEMPLYALIEYSKNRNNKQFIEPYGIAFLREELFESGARPVIYGLSGTHKEADKTDANFGIGLRTLSSECGIGLKEMYRYVYTKISSTKRIDWTHEREWRWADLEEHFEWFSGLPFFAKNDEFNFSKIIVFVKTTEEAENIIEHIQNLYHSKVNNSDTEYDLNTLSNTYVLAIDELANLKKDIKTINLDELPLNSIPKVKKIIVSKSTLIKVKDAIKIASEIYYSQAEKDFKLLGDNGACGWFNIVTYTSNSEITQALNDLNIANSYGKGFYNISLEKHFKAQSLNIQEKGMELAAKYLTDTLGQNFTTHFWWD